MEAQGLGTGLGSGQEVLEVRPWGLGCPQGNGHREGFYCDLSVRSKEPPEAEGTSRLETEAQAGWLLSISWDFQPADSATASNSKRTFWWNIFSSL